MLTAPLSQNQTPTPSPILLQNEAPVATTKETFASPQQIPTHRQAHNTQGKALDWPWPHVRNSTKWFRDFSVFAMAKFLCRVPLGTTAASEKRTSTKESKLKSINAPKHLFFIHYSFPQPRVSSIGFNPWEFLKNIANVASDLNKSKKSAKKNVLLINVN